MTTILSQTKAHDLLPNRLGMSIIIRYISIGRLKQIGGGGGGGGGAGTLG